MNNTNRLQELTTIQDFQELVALLKQPNIFSILKLDRYEIRHSNFIAWLLNPNEKHGLGDAFLNRILKDFLSSEQFNSKGKFKWIKRESVANIDLFIEFENLVIAIENKFDSDEHSDQLTKYRAYVNQYYPHQSKVFVYLTPTGRLTKNNGEYIEYSYKELVTHLEQLVMTVEEDIDAKTKLYIKDYIHSIKANIMKSNPENLLAAKLYEEYKETFDFIMQNANSDLNYISNKIDLLLKDKVTGYVKGSEDYSFSRFTTVDIAKVLKNSKESKRRAWKNKEPMLFEFSQEKENNRLVFLVSISNFNPIIQNKLHKILDDGGLICPNPESNWRIYNNEAVEFIYVNYQEEGYIQQKFEELYERALPIIEKVQQLVIDNKDQLSQA